MKKSEQRRPGLADMENLKASPDVNEITESAERRWGNE